jgi:hypothetical protein
MRFFCKILRNRVVFMLIKKFDFTVKTLVTGGIRTCTFIVKNHEHYHTAMVISCHYG